MCIRDRLDEALARLSEASRERPDDEALRLDAIDVLLQLGPVSYTHLRAHETVLDIVCRLLLEKKNERTNRTIESMHTVKTN